MEIRPRPTDAQILNRRQYLAGTAALAAAGTLPLAGCLGIGSQPTPKTAKAAWEQWDKKHKEANANADERFASAYNLYEGGEYSRSLVDFKKATDAFDDLEADAKELSNANPATDEMGELYRAIRWFYFNISEATASGYLAASAMNDGDAATAQDWWTRLHAHEDEARKQIATIETLIAE